MMVMLVTLEQASQHLRRDTSDDDNDLTLKIHAASAAIINYLKAGATFLDDDGNIRAIEGEPVAIPFEVQAATLLMVGFLYKDRDENADGAYELGYLPKPVMSLLYPLRIPAME